MNEHSFVKTCCVKRICKGCSNAAQKRGMFDCPFCRTPFAKNDSDAFAMVQARVEKKDPEATYFLGKKYFHGELGLQKDSEGDCDRPALPFRPPTSAWGDERSISVSWHDAHGLGPYQGLRRRTGAEPSSYAGSACAAFGRLRRALSAEDRGGCLAGEARGRVAVRDDGEAQASAATAGGGGADKQGFIRTRACPPPRARGKGGRLLPPPFKMRKID